MFRKKIFSDKLTKNTPQNSNFALLVGALPTWHLGHLPQLTSHLCRSEQFIEKVSIQIPVKFFGKYPENFLRIS